MTANGHQESRKGCECDPLWTITIEDFVDYFNPKIESFPSEPFVHFFKITEALARRGPVYPNTTNLARLWDTQVP